MNLRYKINTAIFLAATFGYGIISLIHAYADNGSVSSLEQRALGELPSFSLGSLATGAFIQDFEQYFNDHLPLRTSMAKTGALIMTWKGLPDEEAILVQQGGDNTALRLTGDNDMEQLVQESQDTQYLIYKEQAYTLFKYSNAAAELYAETLNRFCSEVDSAARVYSMLVPTSSEFIDHDHYSQLSDSQKEALGHINELLSSGIQQIDAYSALDQHKEEDIYFRTDHHWTALGAYYAYSEFMKTVGEEAVPLSTFAQGEIDDFLGSSYKATLSYKLKSHPDVITYYQPADSYSYTRYYTNGKKVEGKVVDPSYAKEDIGLYSVFLGGDFPWGEIHTGQDNGKSIVVIKDSYANAFIPYLIPHFESIYYIDPRFYKGSLTAFIEEHHATDVLFLNNSTVARTKGIAELIDQLL